MTTFLTILLALGITTVVVFVWALCRVAAIADRQMEMEVGRPFPESPVRPQWIVPGVIPRARPHGPYDWAWEGDFDPPRAA
jgi:hypothetical protein